MIQYAHGNILDDDADYIAIPVNCVGVMGAGLAKQAAERWPHILPVYRDACQARELRFGRVLLMTRAPGYFQPSVALVPTKQHWRQRSRLEDVVVSLDELRPVIKSAEPLAPAWAIPALGCGLGGLAWEDVRPHVERYLGDLTNEIRVYEPVP